MIKFFKKGTEFKKLAEGFNGTYAMINEFEMQIANNQFSVEDLYIISYLIRREILDRIELYNWNMNTPIIIPLMSKGRLTLNFAFQQTVIRMHKIAESIDLYDEIIGILNKDDIYYEIENTIPSHIKKVVF